MFNSKGGISVVRVGTLAAVFGVLIIFAGYIAFVLDQRARYQPLDIDPPPNAVYYGVTPRGSRAQDLYYRMPVGTWDADQVATYYNDRLAQFERNLDEPSRCVRSPQFGQYIDYQRGNGLVPFQYICMFDNSGFGTVQFTEVTIQPGIYHDNPERNTEGQVIIRYVQQWTGD